MKCPMFRLKSNAKCITRCRSCKYYTGGGKGCQKKQ